MWFSDEASTLLTDFVRDKDLCPVQCHQLQDGSRIFRQVLGSTLTEDDLVFCHVDGKPPLTALMI